MTSSPYRDSYNRARRGGRDRRVHPRVPVEGPVLVWREGKIEPRRARIRDVSAAGALLETEPLPVGEEIRVEVDGDFSRFASTAVVMRSHAAFSCKGWVGIRFLDQEQSPAFPPIKASASEEIDADREATPTAIPMQRPSDSLFPAGARWVVAGAAIVGGILLGAILSREDLSTWTYAEPTAPKTSIDQALEHEDSDGHLWVHAGSAANIRSGPGLGFAIVDQARTGDEFQVLAKRGAWYQLLGDSEEPRWIHQSLVRR